MPSKRNKNHIYFQNRIKSLQKVHATQTFDQLCLALVLVESETGEHVAAKTACGVELKDHRLGAGDVHTPGPSAVRTVRQAAGRAVEPSWGRVVGRLNEVQHALFSQQPPHRQSLRSAAERLQSGVQFGAVVEQRFGDYADRCGFVERYLTKIFSSKVFIFC